MSDQEGAPLQPAHEDPAAAGKQDAEGSPASAPSPPAGDAPRDQAPAGPAAEAAGPSFAFPWEAPAPSPPAGTHHDPMPSAAASPAAGAGTPPPPYGAPPYRPPYGSPFSRAPGAAPQRPRRRAGWLPWVGGGCLLCLLMGGLLVALVAQGTNNALSSLGEGKIGVIRVEGVITGGRGSVGLMGSGGSGSDEIVRSLEKARRSAAIRAVVLRINSPGGSAAASEEIWKEVMKVRRSGKPVIASMGDVAASGGYYVASAADRIIADGATLTGSIGVIMESYDLTGLFKKYGVGENVTKSGRFKDIGSYSRPMTVPEKQLLQGVVNDVYEQFLGAVAEGRKGKIDPEELRRLADGRMFTGRQAKKLNLVDDIGNFQDALLSAAKAARLTGSPRVVELGRTSLFGILASDPDERLRLPAAGLDDERLARVLRRALQEPTVPR